MTQSELTRSDSLRLLTMTRDQASAAEQTSSWRGVQNARRSLIHKRTNAPRTRILPTSSAPLTDRVRCELRRRWHVDVGEITATANETALAA